MGDSGSEGHDGSDDDSQENFNELQGYVQNRIY